MQKEKGTSPKNQTPFSSKVKNKPNREPEDLVPSKDKSPDDMEIFD